jgi:hypothetical protein
MGNLLAPKPKPVLGAVVGAAVAPKPKPEGAYIMLCEVCEECGEYL